MASMRWPSHFTSYSQSLPSGSFSTGVASMGGMKEGVGAVSFLRCLVLVKGDDGASLGTAKLGARGTRPSELFVRLLVQVASLASAICSNVRFERAERFSVSAERRLLFLATFVRAQMDFSGERVWRFSRSHSPLSFFPFRKI